MNSFYTIPIYLIDTGLMGKSRSLDCLWLTVIMVTSLTTVTLEEAGIPETLLVPVTEMADSVSSRGPTQIQHSGL